MLQLFRLKRSSLVRRILNNETVAGVKRSRYQTGYRREKCNFAGTTPGVFANVPQTVRRKGTDARFLDCIIPDRSRVTGGPAGRAAVRDWPTRSARVNDDSRPEKPYFLIEIRRDENEERPPWRVNGFRSGTNRNRRRIVAFGKTISSHL